jgi:hypothetical protein
MESWRPGTKITGFKRKKKAKGTVAVEHTFKQAAGELGFGRWLATATAVGGA